ncbi:hypothetical protein [Dyella tabacisoli]|uniref:DUF1579 domain-containing protein n=1 Tax=Dyella tabacisoli TaxID=2282381 RepID=A0A369UK90_9GAMM|nr:hypothetical protein [Dyella tabacisoli]RDD80966.1 hypothetical protein DVJ77_14795 [Dyella tabacisoli]
MLNAFPMLSALHADGPAADRAAAMWLYGRFVGSWSGRLIYFDAQNIRHETSAEVHFGWALEGRAVQDIWIAPSRSERQPGEPQIMYGATLRVYDPGSDTWQIIWTDPVWQVYDRMTGRADGDNIVQEYRMPDGARCQWMFTEITENSFHWIRRESTDDGLHWELRGEFLLHRQVSDSIKAA